MRRVVLKWDHFSVLQKIEKVRFVVQKMTENAADYPAPNPPLADMTSQADRLEAAETAASEGGKDRTSARDVELAALVDMMDLQVLYVQTISQGNEVLAEKAGMEVKSDGKPWPVPLQPQGFVAKPGKFDGSVYMRCKGTLYKKMYVFQMFVDEEGGKGEWIDIRTQGSNIYLHEGLERGRIYRFRVYATNSAGEGPVSEEATSAAS